MIYKLHYNTVTPLLKSTLGKLMEADEFGQFRLVGGTALSLYRGHRMSVDIDLFTEAEYGTINFNVIENYLIKQFSYTDFNNLPVGMGKSYFIGNDSQNAIKLDLYYTEPFIDDIVVPVESLPEFMPKIQAILDREKFIYTIAGHAGNGNFHIIPLLDFKKEGIADQVTRLSDEVYDLIASYHGSITGEHNDGIVRTPYLHKQFSKPMLDLFKDIKTAFDPHMMFNPGKKVNGSVETIVKYLVKE